MNIKTQHGIGITEFYKGSEMYDRDSVSYFVPGCDTNFGNTVLINLLNVNKIFNRAETATAWFCKHVLIFILPRVYLIKRI